MISPLSRTDTGLRYIFTTAPPWMLPSKPTRTRYPLIIHLPLTSRTRAKPSSAKPSPNGHKPMISLSIAQAKAKSRLRSQANVPRENILVHGVNKSICRFASLRFEYAGTIVVDNLTELKHITYSANSTAMSPCHATLTVPESLAPPPARRCRTTHHSHTQTGQHDSKFGMTRAEILEAAKFCKEHNLPLKGIHFHQGSNFRDPEPLIPAIDMALDLAKEIGFTANGISVPAADGAWHITKMNYRIHPLKVMCAGLPKSVIEGCQQRGLDLPHLHLEPGRSLDRTGGGCHLSRRCGETPRRKDMAADRWRHGR